MTGWRSWVWPIAVFDIILSTSSTLIEWSTEPVAAKRPEGKQQQHPVTKQFYTWSSYMYVYG